MNRRESFKRCIFVLIGSLFLQIFCWAVYSKLSMSVWMCGLSALVTALLYHFIQVEEQTGLSRKNVFIAGILLPFLLAAAVCVTGLLRHPGMTLLGANLDGVSPLTEAVALYAARLLLNGAVLILFAAADHAYLRGRHGSQRVRNDEENPA